MTPVQTEMMKTCHRRKEDDCSKGCDCPHYEFEESTIFEEGQEIMLIEGLEQKMSMMTEKQEHLASEKNEAQKPRKSTRKIQQVLLVPSSRDLVMERYRQASQRSQKARALLHRALNWDVTVPNRGKLVTDALTEAGKARLLIEPEKTPELIAMLSDAKRKGEEEAFRATDLKVSDLVLAVQLPADAADQTSASALRNESHDYPGLENTASTVGIGKTMKDRAMQCSQDAFASMSRGHDDYEGCNDADEHAYRAKQYLEFILPDLGNEARDDASVANKAGKANYENVQVNAPESHDEPSALGEISSLGFDESRSFDNLSSQHSDVFSMSSLNEIMDAPIDECIPDMITNMPSMKRKRLTLQTSFDGSTSQNYFSPKAAASEDASEDAAATTAAANTEHSSSEVQASTPAPLLLKEEEDPRKSIKCRMGFAFARIRSVSAPNYQEEDHQMGGLLRRFRSRKKKAENENTELLEGNIRGPELRSIGAALSDLSEGGHSESVAPSIAMDQGKQQKCGAKEEKQSGITELGTLKKGSSSQMSPTELSNPRNMGVGLSIQAFVEAANVPAKCGAPKSKVVTTNITSNGRPKIVETLEPISGIPNHDRYVVHTRQRDGDQEDERLKQRLPKTPTSIASALEMARCYSPRHAQSEATLQANSPCSSIRERHSRYSPIGVRSEEIVQNSSPCYDAFPRQSVAGKDVNSVAYKEYPSPLSESMNKPVAPAAQNASTEEIQTEGVVAVPIESMRKNPVSLATSSSASPVPSGSTTAKKNKKKRLSLVITKSIAPTIRAQNASLERKPPEGTRIAMTSGGVSIVPSGSTAAKKNKNKRSSLMGLFHRQESTSDANGPNSISNETALKPKLAQTIKDWAKPLNEKHCQREKVSYLQGSRKRAESIDKEEKRLKSLMFDCAREQESKICVAPKKSGKNKPPRNEAQYADRPTLPLEQEEVAVKASLLKTALQLAQDTVEITKIEPIKGNFSSCRAQAAAATLDADLTARKTSAAAQKSQSTRGGKKTGKTSITMPGRKTRCFDKKHQQKPKRNSTTKKETTLQKSFSASTLANGLRTPETEARTATSNAIQGGPISEETTPNPLQEFSPPAAGLPTVKCLGKQGCDRDTTHDKTPEQSSLLTSNPLIPFQLMKQLEEQSMLDGKNVKEAAEKSIIRSHSKLMQCSLASDPTGMSNDLEKENKLSPVAPLLAEGTGTLVSHSPKVNNTTFCTSCQHRPDADGINARKKDVREVLGLPATLEFGADRSGMLLSRIITQQSTHHRDLDLPDP